ncbi:hypothetical protein EDD22DRAFT_956697 [Suillus occidentalis]|nr:hypothetical protein EDD22DRAFT_956697 [Suillus occidentalis]
MEYDIDIKSQSGFSWDNEFGAGIDSTSEAVWAAYVKKLCEDQNTLLDEDGDDEDLIPWETTPPHQSYTPLLKRKSDTFTSSTLSPALKRHYFTDAFRSSSQAQPSSLAPSPIRRQRAMQRAQNIETHLTADEMAALIEAFQTDVNAADAYMVMRDDATHHSFVNRKIIQINSC